MPATSPRGYPYSLPTDPADVPGAIQDLAEAIDLDVESVANSVRPRDAFRVSGTDTLSISTSTPFTTSRLLPFTTVDFNVGDAMPPMGPLTDIVPQLPGFYWIEASITLPRERSTLLDAMTLRVETAAGTLTSTSVHTAAASSDGGQNLELQTGAFFNGSTTLLRAWLTIHAITPTVGTFRFRGRYLSMTRMTTS